MVWRRLVQEQGVMPTITIYTKSYCPYCHDAKALLTSKGQAFTEIPVVSADVQREMTAKAGGRTSVPQIWIGARHVGGCDDLYALEHAGQLDALLKTG
jgi:glutaredoxin 3